MAQRIYWLMVQDQMEVGKEEGKTQESRYCNIVNSSGEGVRSGVERGGGRDGGMEWGSEGDQQYLANTILVHILVHLQ